jgi:hypothetical protein
MCRKEVPHAEHAPRSIGGNGRAMKRSYLVQIATSLQSGFSSGQGVQFQRGGICFVHPESLEKGGRVMVRLPQDLVGLARDVKAKVKWCVPSSAGGYAVGMEYEEPLRWTTYE